MRTRLFFALIVLVATGRLALGQVPAACRTFTAPAASDAWMRELRRYPLAKQLQAIRQRVQCDTALRRRQLPTGDLVSLAALAQLPANNAQRPDGVVLLYIIDEQHFYLNDAATAARFEQVLAKRHVRTIRYFESGPEGTAIFGLRGAEGAILLDSK